MMRNCLILTACIAGGAIAAEPAYPLRPVRAIVPQSPGGANDLTARQLAPLLGERLGQSVVVDNRPGAGAILGSDLVAKAAPDGYTLLISPAAITITQDSVRRGARLGADYHPKFLSEYRRGASGGAGKFDPRSDCAGQG